MTAGRGVQHSEMFPLLNKEKENTLELFQIWINLPKKDKFVDPHFAMLWHEDIPIIKENGCSIKLIAGSYKDHKAPQPAPDSWAANPDNEVAIWNIHLDANAEFELPTTLNQVSRSLYFYEGNELDIEGQKVRPNHGVYLNAQETTILKNGNQKSSFLLLQGKPIKEPVAQHGPFVMNTEEEIQQAFQEYRLTQFGGWPWQYPDNTHPREKGRFAKYPDGKLIEK
jgi:hypothetical protein